MYITFEEYDNLYNPIDLQLFKRLSFDAARVMDIHTTGIDNVKKLKRFYPVDKESADAVKFCAARLINTLAQIQEAEQSMAMSRGYTQTENGLQRKIISRVEAGNEAISYMESNAADSIIDKAAADKRVRDKLLGDIVRECLSGISDANGVNLLHLGKYPRRY